MEEYDRGKKKRFHHYLIEPVTKHISQWEVESCQPCTDAADFSVGHSQ